MPITIKPMLRTININREGGGAEEDWLLQTPSLRLNVY